MEVLQKKNLNYRMIWQFHFWVCIQRKRNHSRRNIGTPMYIIVLFIIANIWNQLKCPSLDEWIKKMYMCIHTHTHTHHTYTHNGILFSNEKEKISCHLQQYRWPWTSLVAQMVKRLSTMWETWVQSLRQEDPLEKEMATHSSILAWEIP